MDDRNSGKGRPKFGTGRPVFFYLQSFFLKRTKCRAPRIDIRFPHVNIVYVCVCKLWSERPNPSQLEKTHKSDTENVWIPCFGLVAVLFGASIPQRMLDVPRIKRRGLLLSHRDTLRPKYPTETPALLSFLQFSAPRWFPVLNTKDSMHFERWADFECFGPNIDQNRPGMSN